MKVERFAELLSTWSAKPGPLHHRLSAAIEGAIRQGMLLPGMRLPSERSLARALSLSRTTVVGAYGRLRETGWLESKVGSGTWVARKQASTARSLTHSNVVSRGSLLNLLERHDPTIIDFALASTEPLADLVEQATRKASEDIKHLLRQRAYMPLGLHSLREAVASLYTTGGTTTCPDQILICTGAQQAISLISSLFLHRGDPVLAENPTYFGALEIFRFAGARTFPVPVTKDHVSPEMLRRRIASVQPRLIYLAPTCQNPTGAIMPTYARQAIARDAEEHEVPIIEDEALADLIIRGRKPQSIASYSTTAPVLTIGSLSKLICPGLRIGWIRGPISIIGRLAKLKSAADLGSSFLTQAIAAELFSNIAEAREQRSRELRAKRGLVLDILRSSHLDWEYTDAPGGMSLWVRMPGVDTQLLSQLALRNSVAIAPGNLFSVDDSHAQYLRLPFILDPEGLSEGLHRLIEAWRTLKQEATASVPRPVMV